MKAQQIGTGVQQCRQSLIQLVHGQGRVDSEHHGLRSSVTGLVVVEYESPFTPELAQPRRTQPENTPMRPLAQPLHARIQHSHQMRFINGETRRRQVDHQFGRTVGRVVADQAEWYTAIDKTVDPRHGAGDRLVSLVTHQHALDVEETGADHSWPGLFHSGSFGS